MLAEERPHIKKQRTSLLSEYVGSDEKIEDLESRYATKKHELEDINTELDKLKKNIKDLLNKEKDLTEKKDKCADAMKKLRTGLRLYRVRDTLIKMGEDGDQTRKEIVEAERKQFEKQLAEDKKRLRVLLGEQRKKLGHIGDTAASVAFEAACVKLEEVMAEDYLSDDVAKVFEWMKARMSLARQGVMRKLYQSIVDDVLHQRKDMAVSLTANTKRADDALRRATVLEARVNHLINNPERDEEALKAAIKARDHQREDCIAHISFLLAGPLREALEDTSPTKHADFMKLQSYYTTKLRSSQALRFEAGTLQILFDASTNDEFYYVRERLLKYQHNFPEVAHYLGLAAVGNLPTAAVHLRRVGSTGHAIAVGTKAFFLKEVKDPSAVPSWPPQWLVDIEHISYILPIVGIREYEGRTYLQTPLQHCNLRTWLANPANRIPKNIQRIFAQILFTVDWLGEYGKFLGTIKPENVFVTREGNAVLDICSVFRTCDHRNEYAPHPNSGVPYATHAYDMWSFAMMLYETCFNTPPPHKPIQREVIMHNPLAFEADLKFREGLADLLVTITTGIDGEHLSSHEALGHPFFASPPPSALTDARGRLSQLSITKTHTDPVDKVPRAHVVPSITSAFADIDKRRKAALHRWEVYAPSKATHNEPNQPFTREVLALYFREVFTHGQLFVSSDTGRYLPDSTCVDSTPYIVLGYLTAKAALTGTPIQCQLAHSVFRFILMDHKEVLYTDLTTALADLYTFDTALARQYKLHCIYPLQHAFTDENGHQVNDDNKERYFINEINKRLIIEPKKQLEWIKQGFKEVGAVWEVVAKLDPTSLARIICGRQWVDEGFLMQQLVFDPRVFYPPTESLPSITSPTPTATEPPDTGSDESQPPTPPVDFDTIPTSIDPPSIEPALAPHSTTPPEPPSSPTAPAVSTRTRLRARSIAAPASLPYTAAMHLHRVLDEWADARDRDRLAKFTFLCTNCVYIPWGGLGDGVFVVLSEDGGPHPHGCCNMLHLPEKESYEEFRDMMEELVRTIDGWIYQLV